MSDVLSLFTIATAIGSGIAILSAPFPAPQAALEIVSYAADPVSKSEQKVLELSEDGRLYVTAVVNEEKLRLLFDTGANRTILNELAAKDLDLNGDGFAYINTVGGTIKAEKANIREMRINGVVFYDQQVLIVKDLTHPLLGMDIIGKLPNIFKVS